MSPTDLSILQLADNNKTTPQEPVDCNGRSVPAGSQGHALLLSHDWYDKLPREERYSVVA